MPASRSPSQSNQLDELFSVLADPERRAIISHLQEMSGSVASLEDLATVLASRTDRDRAYARIRLHHAHLSTLADTAIIEYDSDTNTIRYHGHEDLDCLMETVHALTSTTASP